MTKCLITIHILSGICLGKEFEIRSYNIREMVKLQNFLEYFLANQLLTELLSNSSSTYNLQEPRTITGGDL